MKTIFFNITLLVLFMTGNAVIAQNESTQFEKTQNEIINLINLPHPKFDPNSIQKPMTPGQLQI